MRKRKRVDVGQIVLLIGILFALWLIDGINLSLNDYRLFSLFYDLLIGFWAFIVVTGIGFLLLRVGIKKYWHKDLRGKLIASLYGSVSIPLILLTIVVVFHLALPAYVAKVTTAPTQAAGIVENLRISSGGRGSTTYYMGVNGKEYVISRPWYKELDVGQDLVFNTFSRRAFPERFVNFTFVGMLVTLAVLSSWFYTLYILIFGFIAIFDKSNSFGPLEYLDGIT